MESSRENHAMTAGSGVGLMSLSTTPVSAARTWCLRTRPLSRLRMVTLAADSVLRTVVPRGNDGENQRRHGL